MILAGARQRVHAPLLDPQLGFLGRVPPRMERFRLLTRHQFAQYVMLVVNDMNDMNEAMMGDSASWVGWRFYTMTTQHFSAEREAATAPPVGREGESVVSRHAAGRIMALLFAALGGVGNLPAALLPMYPTIARPLVALVCAVLIAIGLALWFLPWRRWPRWASLCAVPLAFGCIILFNILIPINPYRYALYLIAVFAWIGLAHQRGTSLAFLPLLAVSYLLPLKVTGLLTPASASACFYVALFCVLLGETLSWMVGRLNDTHWKLSVSQNRYRALSENATDLVAIADQQGRYTYASPSFQTVLGYDPDALIGSPVLDSFDARSRSEIARHWASWQQPGAGPTRLEVRARHRDGSWHWFELVARPVLENPAIGGIMAIARDITQRKRMEDELRHQALHDALTGLPNRTTLLERLDEALGEPRRDGGDPALLLLDLDRFKDINDTFGHSYGDAILRQVAARLRAAAHTENFVARLGGDEFAVVRAHESLESARAAAQTLTRALAEPFGLEGYVLHLTASIGIALAPRHDASAADLLRQADVAMYAAKQQGQTLVYTLERDAHSAERIVLIAELRQALARGGLALHYQPKVALATGAVRGVEALARWPHPTRGPIPPEQFVSLAEQTGQMGALTRWVLEEAIRQAHRWLAQGLAIPVAVNLSAANLLDAQLYPTVARLLAAYRVPAALLRLEVTESTLMTDTARALAVLTSLASLGVGLSIDDYGTGYSSLAYIKRLPVDEIKIDRSFVQRVADDESDAVIVASTIGLAQSLGRTVVAEGVESERALKLLRDLACDVAQGYVISPPLPATEVEGWMRERSARGLGSPPAA